MAKFYGKIGYVQTKELRPGVWDDEIVEKSYVGDILKNIKQWQTTDGVIDDVNINIQVSILSDMYADQNLFAIRYVKWRESFWKVTNVNIERPRLVLTIGGVYNGPTVGIT